MLLSFVGRGTSLVMCPSRIFHILKKTEGLECWGSGIAIATSKEAESQWPILILSYSPLLELFSGNGCSRQTNLCGRPKLIGWAENEMPRRERHIYLDNQHCCLTGSNVSDKSNNDIITKNRPAQKVRRVKLLLLNQLILVQ